MTPASELVEHTFPAMGTRIVVRVYAAADEHPAAAAAMSEVEPLLQTFGREAWAWGEGALGEFNRCLARGEAAAVPQDLRALFDLAWRARLRTGGRFEPRVAALVELWGFDEPAHQRRAPPAPAEIETRLAALRRAPDWNGSDVYGPAPGLGWDFGGIGKGWIVDCALERLRERGFGNVLLDAGGNLAVRGARGARAWRIGIRNPRAQTSADALLATLEAHDETVNTHGDDQRYFEHRGRRYAHLLDPATGAPAAELRSLTVVHRHGTRAEAEGAALFVAGRQWPELASQLGLEQVMAVTAEGRVQATAALAARLAPAAGVAIEALPQ